MKRQRKRAGLTQRALADLSGTSLRVIRSYEQGQRSLADMVLDAFGIAFRCLGIKAQTDEKA